MKVAILYQFPMCVFSSLRRRRSVAITSESAEKSRIFQPHAKLWVLDSCSVLVSGVGLKPVNL